MYYKFRIKEFLDQLPAGDYKKAKKELPGLLEIHRVQFSNLINTPVESDYEPRPIILIKLASFFNVKVEDLYRHPPTGITIQDIYIASDDHVSNKLNLTE